MLRAALIQLDETQQSVELLEMVCDILQLAALRMAPSQPKFGGKHVL